MQSIDVQSEQSRQMFWRSKRQNFFLSLHVHKCLSQMNSCFNPSSPSNTAGQDMMSRIVSSSVRSSYSLPRIHSAKCVAKSKLQTGILEYELYEVESIFSTCSRKLKKSPCPLAWLLFEKFRQ